jgi:hypothetical protein
MYFGVSWLDPRLMINETAPEWKESKTGPKNVREIRERNKFLAAANCEKGRSLFGCNIKCHAFHRRQPEIYKQSCCLLIFALLLFLFCSAALCSVNAGKNFNLTRDNALQDSLNSLSYFTTLAI